MDVGALGVDVKFRDFDEVVLVMDDKSLMLTA